MTEMAIERKPDGTPVDPAIAQAEREGRVFAGSPAPRPPRFSPAEVVSLDNLPINETPLSELSEAHRLQAEVEGVSTDESIEFMGEQFRLGAKLGLMPLLKFAHVSNKGVTADDMEGLAAMYSLIKDCIADGEWQRFENTAISKHADEEDLLNVVTNAIELMSARPTKRRSGSAPGSPQTSENSKASSTRTVAPVGLQPLS